MHSYSFTRLALILGLLQAMGPFAIDMYLPGLPAMGRELQASTAAVQASLMAFFLALGLGQLIYGPLSDRVGRKAPLLFGLAVFGLAGVGCALASDIQTLVALRFIQGLGGCAAAVIPRAIVRDLYSGHEAARLMGLLMLVFSVGPILAPLAGSLLIEQWGWRSVFWALTAIGALATLMTTLQLQETWPPARRAGGSWASSLSAYGRLLRDGHYLGVVLIGGLGLASFMIYLANASFVLMNRYGLSARAFSLAFALNAVGFIGGSQFGGFLSRRLGMARLVRWSTAASALSMSAAAALAWSGATSLAALLVPLFAGYAFLGLTLPCVTVLAMDRHGAIAGTAAALMGTLQFLVGALAMTLVGLFGAGHTTAMATGIALCALGAFCASLVVLGSEGGGH